MVTWSNRFMGPSSVVQAALPRILETSKEWFDEVMDLVKVRDSDPAPVRHRLIIPRIFATGHIISQDLC